MKFLLVAVLFSAMQCVLKKGRKTLSHKKSSTRIPRKVSKSLWMNTTPKAETLMDHFGADS